ncbi:uncharacterized protein TNCV_1099031 [Trichonephila clavipes]|nr:uncharacterized protein TNCV_1099031 [Trichonephila clavipes]
MPEPDEIGNLIEDIVDLARQINLEVDNEDVQEPLDPHNQELTMNALREMQEQEQVIEQLESLEPVQSDRMTVGNLTEGLRLNGKKKKLHEGFLSTDHAILNHGQVTWMTPELATPLLTTTPHQREDDRALDRFSVHRCPTPGSTPGSFVVLDSNS